MYTAAINFFLPPVCLMCRDLLQDNTAVCAKCWEEIDFITDPFCESCAYPFSFGEHGHQLKCGACLDAPPSFSKTRAVFKYDHFSKNLILPFKHNKAIHFAPLLGDWMQRAGKDILQDADLFVPVPLHWTRLLKRGFNQAAVLAKRLEKKSQIPAKMTILKRIKRTPSQGDLTVQEREKNVANVFQVLDQHEKLVQGKVVILVDDVMTTGATLNACAKALLRAGAQEVRTLVAARVL
ncbi:MAG: ComF family protein [Alphaproteobacteria bacterium]